jgi:uncharacterized membrane protein
MGLLNFNSKKNKQYNYIERFAKTKIKFKPKFDEFRSTLGPENNLKAKFINVVNDFNLKTDKQVKIRLVFIISILILIFLYLIDFDLTIFF